MCSGLAPIDRVAVGWSATRKLSRNGFVGSWLQAGRLFEDIQERSRAIHSIALRITNPFYDTREF